MGFKSFLRELILRKNKFAISYELLLARRVPKVQKLAETKVEAIMVNCELCKDQKGANLSVDQERASDCSVQSAGVQLQRCRSKEPVPAQTRPLQPSFPQIKINLIKAFKLIGDQINQLMCL